MPFSSLKGEVECAGEWLHRGDRGTIRALAVSTISSLAYLLVTCEGSQLESALGALPDGTGELLHLAQSLEGKSTRNKQG